MEEINFYREDNQIMNDSIDQIIAQIYKCREKGYQSFLLTACGQYNGTTTVAINLAVGLAACGWKVVLVDGDLRKQERYKRHHEEVKHGLTDYLSKEATLEDITYPTNQNNMFYIPGGNSSESPVHLFCSEYMESFIDTLKMKYQYIIYDMPSINVVPEVEIMIPHMDGVMLITSIEQTTKKYMNEAKAHLHKYDDKYMGMIVNRVNMKEYKAYKNDYDYFSLDKQSHKYLKALKRSMRKRKGKV